MDHDIPPIGTSEHSWDWNVVAVAACQSGDTSLVAKVPVTPNPTMNRSFVAVTKSR